MIINDTQILNEYFDEIFQELKTLLHGSTDLYNVRLFAQEPNNPYLPHVQFTKGNRTLLSETQDKCERKYSIEFIVIVYAEDKTNVSRRVIADAIEQKISNFMVGIKGLNQSMSRPIVNLDLNVHRVYMRFTGVFDIDSKIVYRGR